MKLLTITIPCYNSQEYMEHAINSALIGGDDIEIIIVDDGSSDNTLQIAKQYEEKYPSIVRAIHKEKRRTRLCSLIPALIMPRVFTLRCLTVTTGLTPIVCSAFYSFSAR